MLSLDRWFRNLQMLKRFRLRIFKLYYSKQLLSENIGLLYLKRKLELSLIIISVIVVVIPNFLQEFIL